MSASSVIEPICGLWLIMCAAVCIVFLFGCVFSVFQGHSLEAVGALAGAIAAACIGGCGFLILGDIHE